MATELQPGLVLHRRPFSNTSLLLELLTAQNGRLVAVSKGAMRGKGPLAGLLQPFQPLWLAYSGRGEVRTLTRAEAAAAPWTLGGRRLICGLYLNELLMRLLPRDDPHPRVMAAYEVAIEGLAGGAAMGPVLRRFELLLLDELGYGLDLTLDADTGEAVVAERCYQVVNEHGLKAAAPGTRGAIRGATLIALMQGGELGGREAREARDLMRGLLAPHLGTKPLRSRELFAKSPAR